MKIINLISILLLVLSHSLVSKEFKFERMVTDYKGIAYNGNTILCYGQYGIITYSDDLGETWGQINIGDENDIVKILNINETFVGITKNKIMSSTNNGMFWSFKNYTFEEELIDLKLYNGNYYYLTNKHLYISDLNLTNISKVLNSEGHGSFNEFQLLENNIVLIANNNKILKYDNEYQFIDSIIIIHTRTFNNLGDTLKIDYRTIGNLLKDKDNLYVLIYPRLSYVGNLYSSGNYIYKSTDAGSAWSLFSDTLYKSRNLFIDNDEIFYAHYNHLYSFSGIELVKYDKSGKPYNYSTENILPRNIYASKNVNQDNGTISPYHLGFNDYFRIDERILVLVGTGKFIAISYGNGLSWEMKSNYMSLWNTIKSGKNWNYPSKVNDKVNHLFQTSHLIEQIAFRFDSNSFFMTPMYKTTNGGTTFLPQYTKYISSKFTNNYNSLYFSNGKGMIVYNSRHRDTIFYRNMFSCKLTTNDFGDNYNYDTLSYNVQPYSFMYSNIFNNDSIGIIGFCNKESFQNNNLITFYKYNNDLELLDSCSLLGYQIEYIASNRQGQFFTIANKTDEFKNVLLISNDFACTWVEHNLELPYNFDANMSKNLFFDNNQLYFCLQSGSVELDKIYRYNLKLNQLDSMQVDGVGNYEARTPFYISNRKLYYIDSQNRYILELSTEGLFVALDTIKLSDYLQDWGETNPNHRIYDVYSHDTLLNLFTYDMRKVSDSYTGSSYYPTNMIKVTLNPTPTTSVENQTESPTYLYTYPAYPNPARNQVRAMVYWDLRHDINKADIEVYDVMGVRVSGKENILIANATTYNGEIVWDCGSVPEGVYFIKITHGTSTKTVKVAVVR